MPASGFHWSPCPPQTPIFQVYGTKRKAEGCEEQAWDVDMGEETQPFVGAKRHCVRVAPQQASIEMNGFPLQQHQQPSQMTHDHMDGLSVAQSGQQGTEAHMAPWLQVAQQAPQNLSQEEQILPNCVPWPHTEPLPAQMMQDQCASMELSEAAANHMCDMEAAAISMDNDFQPDPSQYTALPAATDTVCAPPPRNGSVAGISESQTNPSRVRCYCKPSWEGMMLMKPYVSDIY